MCPSSDFNFDITNIFNDTNNDKQIVSLAWNFRAHIVTWSSFSISQLLGIKKSPKDNSYYLSDTLVPSFSWVSCKATQE